MQREKAKFNILAKIKDEREKRNWTEYTLAKKAGFPQSTISAWYRKQLEPSVASIEKVCTGFGITLSEFFYDPSVDEPSPKTEEEMALHICWNKLSCTQRQAVLDLLKSMNTK